MAILDLQRREMEQGRIRFGNKIGNLPNRLDHPLLTSPDRELIETVARAHGATVSEWPGGEGQWQVEIDGDLSILLPISPEPVSQWWERWSGGGCLRRCDGFHDQIQDAPCDCDKAAEKRACSATTRFVVLLPETGDARWRVETKSLYAAMELPASLERAQGERSGEVIPAVLSVEQRRGKKGNVPVPVVRFPKSAGDSAPAEQPVEGVAPSAGGRVESPESAVVGSAGSGDSPATISQKQINKMMAVANDNKISTDELKEIVADLAGVRSRKEIPAAKFDLVLAGIQNMGELKAMEEA